MKALSESFYTREDTLEIARELIGKLLITHFNGRFTSGIITEIEAYLGSSDRASHAFGNRRTKRTEVMFAKGGIAYVYLCYGIHHLFNVVTGPVERPHAILIRNIHPIEGIDHMMQRRKKTDLKGLLSGPGTLTEAMGINIAHNGMSLDDEILISESNTEYVKEIKTTPRIGVDYAGDDAKLPYRFLAELNSN